MSEIVARELTFQYRKHHVSVRDSNEAKDGVAIFRMNCEEGSAFMFVTRADVQRLSDSLREILELVGDEPTEE